jgi:hypothetical protein
MCVHICMSLFVSSLGSWYWVPEPPSIVFMYVRIVFFYLCKNVCLYMYVFVCVKPWYWVPEPPSIVCMCWCKKMCVYVYAFVCLKLWFWGSDHQVLYLCILCIYVRYVFMYFMYFCMLCMLGILCIQVFMYVMFLYTWGITQRLPFNRLLFITSDFATYSALIYSAPEKYPRKSTKKSLLSKRNQANYGEAELEGFRGWCGRAARIRKEKLN